MRNAENSSLIACPSFFAIQRKTLPSKDIYREVFSRSLPCVWCGGYRCCTRSKGLFPKSRQVTKRPGPESVGLPYLRPKIVIALRCFLRERQLRSNEQPTPDPILHAPGHFRYSSPKSSDANKWPYLPSRRADLDHGLALLFVAPLTSHRQTPGCPVGTRGVCSKDAGIPVVVIVVCWRVKYRVSGTCVMKLKSPYPRLFPRFHKTRRSRPSPIKHGRGRPRCGACTSTLPLHSNTLPFASKHIVVTHARMPVAVTQARKESSRISRWPVASSTM